jgi:hypothetical protein
MVDCEWDRLKDWALKNQLINEHTGPTEMVSTIIRLVARMDQRIQELNDKVQAGQ